MELARLRARNAQLVHPAIHLPARPAVVFRGGAHAAVVVRKYSDQLIPARRRLLSPRIRGHLVGGFSVGHSRFQPCRQLTTPDRSAFVDDCELMNQAFETAQVLRPGPQQDRLRGIRVERQLRCAHTSTLCPGGVQGLQPRHQIAPALAQWRHADFPQSQSGVQVPAKLPVVDGALQMAIGRRYEPDVDANGSGRAHGNDRGFLDRAQQLGLQLQGQLTDLVQEQGATVGRAEPTFGGCGGAGERAFDVAEQLALHQVRTNRRAVDRHERPRAAAQSMQLASDELLAGAGFADQQRRRRISGSACHRASQRDNASGVARNGSARHVAAILIANTSNLELFVDAKHVPHANDVTVAKRTRCGRDDDPAHLRTVAAAEIADLVAARPRVPRHFQVVARHRATVDLVGRDPLGAPSDHRARCNQRNCRYQLRRIDNVEFSKLSFVGLSTSVDGDCLVFHVVSHWHRGVGLGMIRRVGRPSKLRTCGVLGCMAAIAFANAASADVGSSNTGFPGVLRVAAGEVGPAGTSIALSGGFGRSADVLGSGDAHNRYLARIAAAWRATPWLSVGLRFDSRIDTHSDTPQVAGDTFVGDPRLVARVATAQGPLSYGAELRVWFPGDDAPSIVPNATSADAVALASLRLVPGLTAHANLGARLDRSANSIDDSDSLPDAQRLVLGLSDSNALLFGAGVSYRVGRAELLAEWSWDVLVGDAAPAVMQSPMRAGLGVRYRVARSISVQVAAQLALSDRPDLTSGAPLVPVDPRLTLVAGLVYRASPAPRPRPRLVAKPTKPTRVAPAKPTPPKPKLPAKPEPAIVSGRIIAGDMPIKGATVVIAGVPGATSVTGADGSFELTVAQPRGISVEVRAKGYRKLVRSLAVSPGQRLVVGDVRLEAQLPPGELCVVALPVRSRRRPPKRVVVTITPGNKTLEGAPGKELCAVLAPGRYDVLVRAKGYKTTKRRVRIRKNSGQTRNIPLRP